MSNLTNRQKRNLTLFEAWNTNNSSSYSGDLFNLLETIANTSFDNYPCPWSGVITATALNNGYFLNHSGNKTISEITYRLLVMSDTDTLNTIQKTQLIYMLYDIYKQKWTALWKTVTADYNPIYNYDMTEQETTNYGKTNDRTYSGTTSNSRSGNNSNENERTSEATATNENSIYGFNSAEASPTDSGEGVNNISENENGSGSFSETDSGTNRFTDNDVEGGSDSRTLTRSGNIGVTTTQQMLQSERELWELWSFVDIVFADCDKYLTLPIYSYTLCDVD